jgi:hypothetical protein|tara:strand:+ start:126 stop:506 length:381 start_codon:yes stop_codon:yes gene_type:complete
MTDREYNGWTNWDTWAFALWVDNTETSYRVRMGLCQTVAESDRDREDMDGVLAKVLRDNADDLLLVSGSTDTHDISKINFAEIAEHWMEDVEDLIPEKESEYDERVRDEDEEGDILMRRDKEERDD